ncbi:hypothetical protein ABH931_002813 [Streptacidiphilus sp. MAP12-33]
MTNPTPNPGNQPAIPKIPNPRRSPEPRTNIPPQRDK